MQPRWGKFQRDQYIFKHNDPTPEYQFFLIYFLAVKTEASYYECGRHRPLNINADNAFKLNHLSPIDWRVFTEEFRGKNGY